MNYINIVEELTYYEAKCCINSRNEIEEEHPNYKMS